MAPHKSSIYPKRTTPSSAALGAVAAGYWQQLPPAAELQAQEIRPARSTRLAPARADYAPDEQTNIDVYERANRGVVNITTRSVSVDNFFMLAVPSEGAGSGSIVAAKADAGLTARAHHASQCLREDALPWPVA